MILGQQRRIIDAEAFAGGMARAMRSVVRIAEAGNSTGRSTAWVLTPQLVIVPDYVVSGDLPSDPLAVQGIADGRVSWEERLEGAPERLGVGKFKAPATDQPLAIALLRMKNAKRLPRLNFATAMPWSGAYVGVLSFPGGRPKMCLSPGTLGLVEESLIAYDADSEPGSSGAPVFDENWRVIGMHMLSDGKSNQGVTVTALLDMLKESRYWTEIASFHRLADLAAASNSAAATAAVSRDVPPPPPPALIRAALLTNFPASRLSTADRALLRPKVVDPDDSRWSLQPSERVKVLHAAGGIATLRQFAPGRPRAAGDRVIKRILEGPPFDLAAADEESLPWWIQAAGWFDGITTDLPTPQQVSRELERRRVRSRLHAIAGPDFQGRVAELAELEKWFKQDPPVPFSLTGIGGAGKSSLVARFAATLPDDTLLLWLDFDRADLAPDDAVSVLTALGTQASVQLENFTAPLATATSWEADAAALGKALTTRSLARPPLLVLDSFEVAQYADRYAELWKTLGLVCEQLPALRVIVSGRAPVSNLELRGRKAWSRHLTGLSADDARAWLTRHGIRGERIIHAVWELPPRGLPLNLHLAFHLVEAGGKVNDLPKDLPPEIVAGFLYDRILNRVRDRALKPVAQAALVLRRLTLPVATEVLGKVVKLPPGEPAEWFGRLAREVSLMEGTTVLTLRHEVRTSALQFLEQAEPKLVRAVDEAAEQWYAAQKPESPELAAELVYHRLRLGDVKGAAKVWRDGCAAYLQYAEENLAGAARKWLEGRAGSGSVAEASVFVWEQEAAERIRNARSRGHERTIHGILSERGDRSQHDSPLVFHEAYELRAAGKREEALAHLEHQGDGEASVLRERAVLRGLLLADLGRKYEADVALRRPEKEDWADRGQGALERLLILAGRLRVATDLDAETEMSRFLAGTKGHEFFRDWVSPIDIVTPELSSYFERSTSDQVTPVRVPEPGESRDHFANTLEKFRLRTNDEPPQLEAQRARVNSGGSAEPGVLTRLVPAPMAKVMECGWRRWAIAAESPRFGDMLVAAFADTPLAQVLLGSAALFVGFGHLKLAIPKFGLADTRYTQLSRTMLARIASKSAASPTLRSVAIEYHRHAPHPLEVLVDRFAGKEPAA